jgi:hypothetical protein
MNRGHMSTYMSPYMTLCSQYRMFSYHGPLDITQCNAILDKKATDSGFIFSEDLVCDLQMDKTYGMVLCDMLTVPCLQPLIKKQNNKLICLIIEFLHIYYEHCVLFY